jgi:hypothetical protein
MDLYPENVLYHLQLSLALRDERERLGTSHNAFASIRTFSQSLQRFRHME